MIAKNNKLDFGQSRIGVMIHDLKETPQVAVKLERTNQGIELTVPFLDGMADVNQYWFSEGQLTTVVTSTIGF